MVWSSICSMASTHLDMGILLTFNCLMVTSRVHFPSLNDSPSVVYSHRDSLALECEKAS
ncbi:hypothetical protein D3C78_1468510 [compost metagenome]